MYGIRKFFAAVLSVAGILGATAADNLTVETPAALFPLPGADTQLVLAEKMPSPDGEVKYVVRDYTGKETGASTARRQAGKITLDLKLGAGYHELFFPEYNQSVGLAVHPDAPAGPDGYWCMDSGLTWSYWPQVNKIAIVEQLKRKGISSFRERFSWWQTDDGSAVKEGVETAVRDSVYGENRILELLADSPATPFAIRSTAKTAFWSSSRILRQFTAGETKRTPSTTTWSKAPTACVGWKPVSANPGMRLNCGTSHSTTTASPQTSTCPPRK